MTARRIHARSVVSDTDDDAPDPVHVQDAGPDFGVAAVFTVTTPWVMTEIVDLIETKLERELGCTWKRGGDAEMKQLHVAILDRINQQPEHTRRMTRSMSGLSSPLEALGRDVKESLMQRDFASENEAQGALEASAPMQQWLTSNCIGW
jgi:hypothetical protein